MSVLITDGPSFWARSTPKSPALIFDGHDVVNYATLDRWTDNAAGLLADRGLAAGQRVGIAGSNSLEWCVAALGALKLGAVVVPYNNRFTVPELTRLIADSQPTLVLTDDHTSGRLTEAVVDQAVPLVRLAQFTELRGEGHRSVPRPSREPDDIAMIVYTSGSTAAPKGVIYTHRSIFSLIAELAITEPALRPGARMIYTLSMSGAPGLPWHILHPLSRGMTVYYEKGFDGPTVLTRLATERINVMCGVPVQFEQVAAQPEFIAADLSSLQLCTIAGARVALSTLQAWQGKGVPLRQAYGMTELSGLSSVNSADDAALTPESIGRGTVFTRHQVVRPDGQECMPGEPGEIVVSGPALTPGYWRNADATAQLIRDGRLHTGDVGIADHQGRITVVDRMKDLIISGGYNISPSEIESAIQQMPGVVEVCVIAVPDAKFGETPAAVVHSDSTVTPADILQWCTPRLATYKLPRFVVIESAPLPRMTSGKIARRQIRDIYGDRALGTARLR